MSFNRRQFIKSSLASVPVVATGFPLQFPQSRLFSSLAFGNTSDRVLVLINLIGGNDGLASLTPLDQYDNLAAVRGNILLPQNRLHSLTPTLAVHPGLTPLRDLYTDGRLGIVQGVGYPDQNGSPLSLGRYLAISLGRR